MTEVHQFLSLPSLWLWSILTIFITPSISLQGAWACCFHRYHLRMALAAMLGLCSLPLPHFGAPPKGVTSLLTLLTWQKGRGLPSSRTPPSEGGSVGHGAPHNELAERQTQEGYDCDKASSSPSSWPDSSRSPLTMAAA